MEDSPKQTFILNRSDVIRQYTCSGGKGGQNVNRRSTCVILTHKPTGIMVRSEENRTQGKNEEAAWIRLTEKLASIYGYEVEKQINETRSVQIGVGNRGDKRRTYRIQDGIVKDDISGRTISVKDLYKGRIDLLHKTKN